MNQFKKVLLIGIAMASQSLLAAPLCLNSIVLKDAKFLGDELFPTRVQIETGLNQSIHDLNGHPAWGQEDLEQAVSFVEFAQRLYGHHGPLTLPLEAGLPDPTCEGHLAGYSYFYDPAKKTVNFSEDGFNDDVVTISIGRDSAVVFQAEFASNCSNCSSQTELFEFGQVEAQ